MWALGQNGRHEGWLIPPLQSGRMQADVIMTVILGLLLPIFPESQIRSWRGIATVGRLLWMAKKNRYERISLLEAFGIKGSELDPANGETSTFVDSKGVIMWRESTDQ